MGKYWEKYKKNNSEDHEETLNMLKEIIDSDDPLPDDLFDLPSCESEQREMDGITIMGYFMDSQKSLQEVVEYLSDYKFGDQREMEAKCVVDVYRNSGKDFSAVLDFFESEDK